jgi:hypothetical protein
MKCPAASVLASISTAQAATPGHFASLPENFRVLMFSQFKVATFRPIIVDEGKCDQGNPDKSTLAARPSIRMVRDRLRPGHRLQRHGLAALKHGAITHFP